MKKTFHVFCWRAYEEAVLSSQQKYPGQREGNLTIPPPLPKGAVPAGPPFPSQPPPLLHLQPEAAYPHHAPALSTLSPHFSGIRGSSSNNISAGRWKERDFLWHFISYLIYSTLFLCY